MAIWRTNIAGVTFANGDGMLRQTLLRALVVGEQVALEREWKNDFDPNAIAVFASHGQLGYIPASMSKRLVQMNYARDAKVISVHGGSPSAPTIGAEISFNVEPKT